jgi:hypothetical protein
MEFKPNQALWQESNVPPCDSITKKTIYYYNISAIEPKNLDIFP